jgi:hypothetical protein
MRIGYVVFLFTNDLFSRIIEEEGTFAMRVVSEEMIKYAKKHQISHIVFTANALLLFGQELCMGGGAAAAVAHAFPGVEKRLGQRIGEKFKVFRGVCPDYFLEQATYQDTHIYALQVKRHVTDHLRAKTQAACFDLMLQSLDRLKETMALHPEEVFIMNMPLVELGGCANEEERVMDELEKRFGETDQLVPLRWRTLLIPPAAYS